jgi:hypothetical protein
MYFCRCISIYPPIQNEEGESINTREIGSDFFWNVNGDVNCLRLGTVTGLLECRYYMESGLGADAETVLSKANQNLKTFATGQDLDWQIAKSMVPSSDTTSYIKAMPKPGPSCLFSVLASVVDMF